MLWRVLVFKEIFYILADATYKDTFTAKYFIDFFDSALPKGYLYILISSDFFFFLTD